MGLEQTNHDFRYLELANEYNTSEYDTAEMKVHHTQNPATNYCLVELKMPSIERQFTIGQFDSMLESIYSVSLHGLNFLKVNNNMFYEILHKEGAASIDKVRRVKDGVAYTYYFSSTRTVRLFPHDYSMASLIYLNYPIRNYIHRTPCKDLVPRCAESCLRFLAAPVKSYLDDDPSLNIKFSDFFFSYIEDNHRLIMAYSIEKVKKVGECFLPNEPDYYIQDMSMSYFSDSIIKRSVFESVILKERKEEDTNMYYLSVGKAFGVNYGNFSSGDINQVSFGVSSATSSIEYNYKNKLDVPDDIFEALSNSNFESLWMIDFLGLNVRNSIYKYQFNYWVYSVCTRSGDGFWCAWDASETISRESSGFGEAGSQVSSQLNQVANSFGWGASVGRTSTDTVYTLISVKYPGVNYEKVIEPLPNRPMSFM